MESDDVIGTGKFLVVFAPDGSEATRVELTERQADTIEQFLPARREPKSLWSVETFFFDAGTMSADPDRELPCSGSKWLVSAAVKPIVHSGTMQECEAWIQMVIGREVTVADAEGVLHTIGVVEKAEAKAVSP